MQYLRIESKYGQKSNIFKISLATVKTSIRLIFSSEVGLREKQTTAYFAWLNIDLFSRKSILIEYR